MKERINVKEYEFDKPLIHKIDSIIGNCIADCHNEYFQRFKKNCVYDIQQPKKCWRNWFYI